MFNKMITPHLRGAILAHFGITRATDRKLKCFPGVYNDAKYALFLTKLFIAVEQEMPTVDWTGLLNQPGYLMNPLGNPSEVKHPSANPLALSALTLLSELAFERAEPKALRVKTTSNTSFPYMSSSIEVKKGIIDFWLNHYDQIFDLIGDKDLKALAKLPTPVVFAGNMITRAQPDTLSSYRVSGGRIVEYSWKERAATLNDGSTVIADKQITHLQKIGLDHMQRMRARQGYGVSHTVNLVAQVFWSSIQEALYKIGPMMWKHSDLNFDLSAIPSQFSFVAKSDAKEYDKHIDLVHQVAMNTGFRLAGMQEDAGNFLLLASRPTILRAPDYKPYSSYSWSHDPNMPFDEWAQQDYGLMSGEAGVSAKGRLMFGALTLAAMDQLGWIDSSNERQVMQFLSGQHPRIIMKNSSDDNIAFFTSDSDREAFSAAMSNSGFDIEPEDEVTYLGHQIMRKGDQWVAIPALANGLVNIAVPEHSVDSPHRMHHGFGFNERQNHYMKNPMWPVALDIFDHTFHQHFGYSIRRHYADKTIKYNQLPRDKMIKNYADSLFVVNPDIIHYRVPEKHISEALINEYFYSVPLETILPIFNRFFNRR